MTSYLAKTTGGQLGRATGEIAEATVGYQGLGAILFTRALVEGA